MFLCAQKPPSWQCLQLVSEVSSLELSFWRKGAPSGACGAWKAAAVSGTPLKLWGQLGCLSGFWYSLS